MKKKEFLSLPLNYSPYSNFPKKIIEWAILGQSKYACVANVHMLVEVYQKPEFASVVHKADMVTPDGKPLTWGLRLLYGQQQDRIAGMFLMQDVLKEAERKNLQVAFYGSTPKTLAAASLYLKKNYPDLQIADLISPPFRTLTSEEEEEYVHRINASGARIVFVALGCPKQEKWMASMKGRVQAVMIGIGAALPVMVGLRKKAPLWIQNIGMEWFFRLCLEPRRLFKRYAITNSIFIYLLIKEWIRIRILSERRMFKKVQAAEKTDACT